jgi:hypothetical protein
LRVLERTLEAIELLHQNGMKVLARLPRVKEHRKSEVSHEVKLSGKEALLRVLVAKLQAVVVQAAFPNRDAFFGSHALCQYLENQDIMACNGLQIDGNVAQLHESAVDKS